MSNAITSDRVKSLLEEALWELSEESTTHSAQTDTLDSMIDAARANFMAGSGMMPAEAGILFSLTEGSRRSSSTGSTAAHAATLREIHVQANHPPPPPMPTESPSSVVDGAPHDQVMPSLQTSGDEPPAAPQRDADGEEWDKEWDEWPSDDPPAVAAQPTPAERAAAAAQRLVQERALRERRNGGTLRNRAAEIAAEAAADAVLANLPSPPPRVPRGEGDAARW